MSKTTNVYTGFIPDEATMKRVVKVVSYMKEVLPDPLEEEKGVSMEIARERMNILLASYVLAILNYEQPLDYVLENVKIIYNGLQPLVIPTTFVKETLN